MGNVVVAKKAFAHYIKRYEEWRRGVAEYTPIDWQPFFDCLADDVVVTYSRGHGVDAAETEFHGKKAVIDKFEHLTDVATNFEMIKPLEFIGDRDRVVVVGVEKFTLKKENAVIGPLEFAIVLTFRNGLISRYQAIEDMSHYVAAIQGNK